MYNLKKFNVCIPFISFVYSGGFALRSRDPGSRGTIRKEKSLRIARNDLVLNYYKGLRTRVLEDTRLRQLHGLEHRTSIANPPPSICQ